MLSLETDPVLRLPNSSKQKLMKKEKKRKDRKEKEEEGKKDEGKKGHKRRRRRRRHRTSKGRDECEIRFSRVWNMPSSKTFTIRPIEKLLERYLSPLSGGVIIDPFARNSPWGTLTNDLNEETDAQHHMEATAFLQKLIDEGETVADAVLLDPPYSPRQISECYKQIGRKVSSTDTQNARLYKQCKDKLNELLKPGGLAITFGWNSAGFGKTRGFKIVEILLVPHGAAHNDTIVTVERKL